MPINGLLCDKYSIPAYAQKMLYLVGDFDTAHPVAGEKGSFTLLGAPIHPIRLAWGSSDGPWLAYWKSPKLTKMGLTDDADLESLHLNWDGTIRAGGYIERLHALEVGSVEIVIAEIVGGVLPEDHAELPALDAFRAGAFSRNEEQRPMRDDQVYFFIANAESNLSALLQDALVARIAVDVSGTLAEPGGRWHKTIGLPLLLETLTLLAP